MDASNKKKIILIIPKIIAVIGIIIIFYYIIKQKDNFGVGGQQEAPSIARTITNFGDDVLPLPGGLTWSRPNEWF
tara:strand:- start:1681 stop:1905 length:225 start_codon:yes stop_codon:yes gene_type:complete